MFDKLKRIFSKPEIDHPIFGRILFEKPGYWVGQQCHFQTTDQELEVCITAGTEGPSEEQVAFFLKLQAQYEFLQPAIADFLHAECDIEKEGIWEHLSLEYLQITNHCPGSPQHWQAGYAQKDDDHVISVEFRDFVPKGTFIDG